MIRPVTEHTVEASGLSLRVLEAGDAADPTVLLVHGWPDTAELWRHQIPALAQAGYHVLAHDQRGFGRSERPADLAGYHVFNAMGDLSSILDHFDVAASHLVGHDWGAPPCWLLTAFEPRRVRSLTAVSVGHPQAFRNAGIEQRRRSFYMLLFQFEEVAEQWLQNDDWANMRMLVGDTAEWDRWKTELAEPGALTSSLNWYRSNLAPKTLLEPPVELPRITRPTMGVMGEYDWALTATQMTDSEAYVDADWRYECVADAAHWVPTDQPDELTRLLVEWIGDHA
ncbi:MAG: alpha/beta fold hydrolase [Acidimicrobiales bacterium]